MLLQNNRTQKVQCKLLFALNCSYFICVVCSPVFPAELRDPRTIGKLLERLQVCCVDKTSKKATVSNCLMVTVLCLIKSRWNNCFPSSLGST